jgi:hypothetical protein
MIDRVPSNLGGIAVSNRFRSPSVKNAGKDADGKVLPHNRSEEIAGVVAALAAGGASLNLIAVRLNLRPGQIKKHYANELEYSAEAANVDVASAALSMARSGEDAAMTKFWLKARAKWRDGESGDDKSASFFNIHIHNQ